MNTRLNVVCHLIHLIAAEFVGHISETLIIARCPTPSCGELIPDFDACAGLQCGRFPLDGPQKIVIGTGCGAHFCAWCFQICRDKVACHDHVRTCAFNLNQGVIIGWAEYENHET